MLHCFERKWFSHYVPAVRYCTGSRLIASPPRLRCACRLPSRHHLSRLASHLSRLASRLPELGLLPQLGWACSVEYYQLSYLSWVSSVDYHLLLPQPDVLRRLLLALLAQSPEENNPCKVPTTHGGRILKPLSVDCIRTNIA